MNSDEVMRALIDKVFSDPDRMVTLKKGDLLLKSDSPNDRLYYVDSGTLSGREPETKGGMLYDCLFAKQGDLLGVRSFFSDNIASHATVVADEDCELRYVTMTDLEREHTEPRSNLLLPLLSQVLLSRQKATFNMMKKDQELDRLNFLGQFSAGVAHELNNALAVIVRGTEWMNQVLDQQMQKFTAMDYTVYSKGAKEGRSLSSQEVREKTKQLQKEHDLGYGDAKKMAQMGLREHDTLAVMKSSAERQKELQRIWDMGATFKDIQLSAQHASSVVESMKSLGARGSMMLHEVDLNDSLEAALVICRNVTKGIDIECQLDEESPLVLGSKGELVQVWTNLIKNACDAMRQSKSDDLKIIISTTIKGERLLLSFQDTGPGIPDEVMPKIFMPNFTTKKSGLNFGLGLGLSIVQKIVQSFGGFISADNTDIGARFQIDLPLFIKGDDHA
jgi:signal transduction histidine kinase